jgi:hypothetical protein
MYRPLANAGSFAGGWGDHGTNAPAIEPGPASTIKPGTQYDPSGKIVYDKIKSDPTAMKALGDQGLRDNVGNGLGGALAAAGFGNSGYVQNKVDQGLQQQTGARDSLSAAAVRQQRQNPPPAAGGSGMGSGLMDWVKKNWQGIAAGGGIGMLMWLLSSLFTKRGSAFADGIKQACEAQGLDYKEFMEWAERQR